MWGVFIVILLWPKYSTCTMWKTNTTADWFGFVSLWDCTPSTAVQVYSYTKYIIFSTGKPCCKKLLVSPKSAISLTPLCYSMSQVIVNSTVLMLFLYGVQYSYAMLWGLNNNTSIIIAAHSAPSVATTRATVHCFLVANAMLLLVPFSSRTEQPLILIESIYCS
jgi:hypothetical protein